MKTEIMEVCNQEMKKKEGKNKGFSLVELIVVIAIMAILAIVIAPQVMKYIGQSRSSVDATNISLYKSAVSTALANEAAYTELAATNKTYTIKIEADGTSSKITSTDVDTTATGKFISEFKSVLGNSYPLPKQSGKTHFQITIEVTGNVVGTVKVTAEPTS